MEEQEFLERTAFLESELIDRGFKLDKHWEDMEVSSRELNTFLSPQITGLARQSLRGTLKEGLKYIKYINYLVEQSVTLAVLNSGNKLSIHLVHFEGEELDILEDLDSNIKDLVERELLILEYINHLFPLTVTGAGAETSQCISFTVLSKGSKFDVYRDYVKSERGF